MCEMDGKLSKLRQDDVRLLTFIYVKLFIHENILYSLACSEALSDSDNDNIMYCRTFTSALIKLLPLIIAYKT